MFIGIGRYEIFIAHSGSLKDKRRVLRAVTMSVQKRFNVAIAEVDYQDKWQRAALGVQLRQVIERDHSLDRLIDILLSQALVFP